MGIGDKFYFLLVSMYPSDALCSVDDLWTIVRIDSLMGSVYAENRFGPAYKHINGQERAVSKACAQEFFFSSRKEYLEAFILRKRQSITKLLEKQAESKREAVGYLKSEIIKLEANKTEEWAFTKDKIFGVCEHFGVVSDIRPDKAYLHDKLHVFNINKFCSEILYTNCVDTKYDALRDYFFVLAGLIKKEEKHILEATKEIEEIDKDEQSN